LRSQEPKIIIRTATWVSKSGISAKKETVGIAGTRVRATIGMNAVVQAFEMGVEEGGIGFALVRGYAEEVIEIGSGEDVLD
jgi:hypothetical protein